MIGTQTAYAVLNNLGNEANRFCYPEMAANVAARFDTDPSMAAFGPYTVAKVDRDAPVIIATR